MNPNTPYTDPEDGGMGVFGLDASRCNEWLG